MDPTNVLDLREVLKQYVPIPELRDLATLFDVPWPDDDWEEFHLGAAKHLISHQNSGNNPRLLTSLLDLCLNRSRKGISRSQYAEQDVHSAMYDKIERLSSLANEFSIPEEVNAQECSPFRAKSLVRDMLDEASTPVRLVDQYVGTRTLDCFRDVSKPISILTGTKEQSLESGFLRSLADFRAEGHDIEVRSHARLHDRYIIFNDRVWLLGGSLKDAGRKTFSLIEIVDTKQSILTAVDQKWAESVLIPKNS